MAKGPCFYCLDKGTCLAICLDCKSKHQMLKAEAERLRQDIQYMRAKWFGIEKENRRLKQEILEMRKKK